MRKKLLATLLALAMVFTLVTPVTVMADTNYASGADDEAKTFGISTKADLDTFRDGFTTYRSYRVSLNADIDLGGASYTQSLLSGAQSVFTGTFYGNGHTLSNFTVTGGQALGFVPELSGRIENLKIHNATFTSTSYFVGAVVGRLIQGGVVDGVTVTNTTVSGTEQVGGIVGKVGANSTAKVCTIQNCTVTGGSTITTTAANGRVGGILGQNQANVTITGCTVDGCTISADGSGPRAGGILGYATGTSIGDITISDCYVNAVVQTASGGRAGGILGFTDAHLITLSLDGCVFVGTSGKAGTFNNGGLLGQLQNTGNLTVVMEDCIAFGCTVGSNTGALIGMYSNASPLTITRCGYVGDKKWQTMTGTPTETDLQTVQIANGVELANAAKAHEAKNISALTLQSAATIEISTAEQLWGAAVISKLHTFSGTTLQLTDDIDLGGIANFPMIGNGTTKYFYGSFDGQNHEIRNLTVSAAAAYSGLFMAINGSGTIGNFTLVNAQVSGTEHVGAVAGFVRDAAVISNVTVDAASSVTGSSNAVGGIAGRVANDVQVTSCTVNGDVTGVAGTGGIAGRADLAKTSEGIKVTGCTVNGDVTGTGAGQMIGGIIGQMKANTAPTVTITGCSVNGDVTGNANKVGGMVGGPAGNTAAESWASLAISGGSVTGVVTGGGTDVGGVIATVGNDMTITGVTDSATVLGGESTTNVGGVIGAIRNGTATVENAWFSGRATNIADGKFVGGIAANVVNNSSSLHAADVWISGTVEETVKGYAGGVVGGTNAQGPVEVTRALVTGTVHTPIGQAGAILGETSNTGSNYLTGTVTYSYALTGVCTGASSSGAFGLLGSSKTEGTIDYSTAAALALSELSGVNARTNAAGLFDAEGDEKWTSVVGDTPVLAAFSDATEITAKYYADISVYRSGTYTAPVAPAGTVFAGWFTDEALTTALGEGVTSGEAYAKFVDANLLTVKYQQESGKSESGKSKLRIVTTVDTMNFTAVGFKLEYTATNSYTGANAIEKQATTVYSELLGYADPDTGISYAPSFFSNEAYRFFAFKLVAADATAGRINTNDGITATPFWITLDGTKVYGTEKGGLTFNILEG